jgi:hypothetical protein
MFAGEGGPERTNKRFHYVVGLPAKRYQLLLIGDFIRKRSTCTS